MSLLLGQLYLSYFYSVFNFNLFNLSTVFVDILLINFYILIHFKN